MWSVTQCRYFFCQSYMTYSASFKIVCPLAYTLGSDINNYEEENTCLKNLGTHTKFSQLPLKLSVTLDISCRSLSCCQKIAFLGNAYYDAGLRWTAICWFLSIFEKIISLPQKHFGSFKLYLYTVQLLLTA